MKLGIDPGITGALALLNDRDELCSLFDMPIMPFGKNKQQVNPAELTKVIGAMGANNSIAYVEMVSAMPGQGVTACFNFGMGYGIIQGILASLGLPMILVTPGSWKKRAGLVGKEKDAARTLAQQLYPAADLGRKKDIGRADAILIARFGAK